MRRISTEMPANDMRFSMGNRDFRMSEVQKSIGNQSRLNSLRDDPIAASRATRLQSSTFRLNRFDKNIQFARGQYAVTEGYLQESVSIMQRVRELAVQGGHGTYAKEDLQMMAVEVNELLKELVSVGNAVDGESKSLFGGDVTGSRPFTASESRVAGINGTVITNVRYNGSIGEKQAEVSEGTTVSVNIPGNRLFWAEQQQIYSSVNSSGFTVEQDSQITIDGIDIALKAGDSVQDVISKINSSDASVKGSLDPVTNSIVLTSTEPHQIWLDEKADSTVLKDLGLISERGSRPPENLHEDVRVSGGSLFDMVMQLRDNLLKGDYESIGSGGIRGIDSGLNNLMTGLSKLGAMDNRIVMTSSRIGAEIEENTRIYSQAVDVDMTEAALELKMLEVTQKAAYSSASKILQPKLMDFLR
ncbi:flagellar hook-associated protein 3 [Spirochaeta isovalerica]|uniref:Flagellar hook-associated protein 3 FlgL n=1 Tax=Spirochaeta isovalerica TaxID=150 RepID=A0A841R699_9SPIO|nr:flagellar hook-associated protein 3 [Spirochaeta isovalerica]MBB6478687.1 flagellar hook-associated protein 3 FlgL [Spirochaeta isovalerica]